MQLKDAHVRHRHERGRTRLARDHRHLADDVAGASNRELLLVGSKHLHLAVDNDVKRVAGLASDRKQLASRKVLLLGDGRDRFELLRRERFEEGDLAQENHALDQRDLRRQGVRHRSSFKRALRELGALPYPSIRVVAEPIDHLGVEAVARARFPEREQRPDDRRISDRLDDLERCCALSRVGHDEVFDRGEDTGTTRAQQRSRVKRGERVALLTRAKRIVQERNRGVFACSESASEVCVLERARNRLGGEPPETHGTPVQGKTLERGQSRVRITLGEERLDDGLDSRLADLSERFRRGGAHDGVVVREQGDERFDPLFLRGGGDCVCRLAAHSSVEVVEPGQRKAPCFGSARGGDRAVSNSSNGRIRRVHNRVEHGLRPLVMFEEDRGGERADRDLLVVEHLARRVYTGAGQDSKSGKAHR